jgi:uncharacterized membrane protein YgdD (TMEM256/DUF423 family)
MTPIARVLLASGALVMALGVVLSALSSHAMKNAVHPDAPRLLQIAVQYQLIHGLGLLLIGALARQAASTWLVAAGVLLILGILFFCGSLWYLAMANRSMGPIAPLGGIFFIVGWLALAFWVIQLPSM